MAEFQFGPIAAESMLHPVDINILGNLRQGAELQAQRLQNQKLLAQKAAGQDYQASIGANGVPSMSQFGSRLANDPNAAMDAFQAHQEALNNATSAFKLHIGQMETLGRIAYNLGASGASRSEVLKNLVDMTKSGVLSASQAATQAANLPTDQAEMHAELMRAGTQMTDQATQARQYIGEQQFMNTGSNMVPYRAPVLGSPYSDGAPVSLGLSPGQAATPTTLPGTTGTSVMPLGSYAAQNGIGGGATSVGGGAPSPRSPMLGGPMPTSAQRGPANIPNVNVGPGVMPPPEGSVTPAPVMPRGNPAPGVQPRPLAPAADAQPPAQPGAMGITFPSWAKPNEPGQPIVIPNDLADKQKQSTATYLNLQSEIGTLSKQRNLLENIVAEGSQANAGAGAGRMEVFGSIAQELGLSNGGQASAYALTQKNVSQLIQAQASKLGVPTDDKMAQIMAGSPNANMPPQALRAAAGLMLGNLDYAQAEFNAFHAYTQKAQAAGIPLNSGAYNHFNAQFQQKVPVAVFQWAHLSPRQRATYYASLGKAGQANFKAGAQFAMQHGLITQQQMLGQ